MPSSSAALTARYRPMIHRMRRPESDNESGARRFDRRGGGGGRHRTVIAYEDGPRQRRLPQPGLAAGEAAARRRQRLGLRDEGSAASRSGPSCRRRGRWPGVPHPAPCRARRRPWPSAWTALTSRSPSSAAKTTSSQKTILPMASEYLSGIEHAGRIEGGLDPAHRFELHRRLVARQLRALQLADAVFGAEAAAARRDEIVDDAVGGVAVGEEVAVRDAARAATGCSADCRRRGGRRRCSGRRAARRRARRGRRRGSRGSPRRAARCRA